MDKQERHTGRTGRKTTRNPGGAGARRSKGVTREQAIATIQGFLRSHGIDSSPGLDERNVGGLVTRESQLRFDYVPDPGVLVCSALVYPLPFQPAEDELAKLRNEAAALGTSCGVLHFDPNDGILEVRRSYDSLPGDAEFHQDMTRLWNASRTLDQDVLDRVF